MQDTMPIRLLLVVATLGWWQLTFSLYRYFRWKLLSMNIDDDSSDFLKNAVNQIGQSVYLELKHIDIMLLVTIVCIYIANFYVS